MIWDQIQESWKLKEKFVFQWLKVTGDNRVRNRSAGRCLGTAKGTCSRSRFTRTTVKSGASFRCTPAVDFNLQARPMRDPVGHQDDEYR